MVLFRKGLKKQLPAGLWVPDHGSPSAFLMLLHDFSSVCSRSFGVTGFCCCCCLFLKKIIYLFLTLHSRISFPFLYFRDPSSGVSVKQRNALLSFFLGFHVSPALKLFSPVIVIVLLPKDYLTRKENDNSCGSWQLPS